MKHKIRSVIFLCFMYILFIPIVNADITAESCVINPEYIEYINNKSENTSDYVDIPLQCLFETDNNNKIFNDITQESLLNLDTQNDILIENNSTPLTNKKNDTNPTVSSRFYWSPYITSVKNQRSTGTCWAHSGLANVESNILKTTGKTYNFSEVHLEYGATYSAFVGEKNMYGYSRIIDSGGGPYMTQNYLFHNLGTVEETTLSIDNYETTIYNKNKITRTEFDSEQKIADVNYTMSSIGSYTTENSVLKYTCDTTTKNKMKQYLLAYGALDVHLYYSTSSTIYNSTNDALFYNGKYQTNHAVTLVGWDDDYSASNFNTYNGSKPTSNGAWIIKNSHGTYSNDEGYFYVSYEDSTICSSFSVYGDIDFSFADNNYERTNVALASANSVNLGTQTIYTKNIVTKTSSYDELVKEVSINNFIDKTQTVSIYVLKKGETFKTSRVADATAVISPYTYQTIKLDKPIRISDDSFQVITKYTASSGNVAYTQVNTSMYDTLGTLVINSGENYISKDGSTWQDMKNLEINFTSADGTSKVIKGASPVIIIGTDDLKMNIYNKQEITEKTINTKDGGIINALLQLPGVDNTDGVSYKILNSKNVDVTSSFTTELSAITNTNGVDSVVLQVIVPNTKTIPVDEYKLVVNFKYDELDVDIEDTVSFNIYPEKKFIIEDPIPELIFDKTNSINLNYTTEGFINSPEINVNIKNKQGNDLTNNFKIQILSNKIIISKKDSDQAMPTGDYTLLITETSLGNCGSYEITINKYEELKTLSFDYDELYLKLDDEVHEIPITINPENASFNKPTYSITNPESTVIEYVEDDKYNILSLGNATIKASIKDEFLNKTFEDEMTVHVVNPQALLSGIKYTNSNNEASNIYSDISGIVTYKLSQESVNGYDIEIKLNNNTISTITVQTEINGANSNVILNIPEGLNAGVYDVSIKPKMGNEESAVYASTINTTFEIKESIPAERIEFTNKPNNLKINTSEKIGISVLPETTSNKTITYSSSNTNVASISSNGNVLSKGYGTTTITACLEKNTNLCVSYELTNDYFKLNDYKTTNIDNIAYVTNISLGTTKEDFEDILKNDSQITNYTITYPDTNKGNKISTGTEVSITSNNETKTYTLIVFGDVYEDGEINKNDYLTIRDCIMNLKTLKNSQKFASDINFDGKIDVIDYIKVYNYIRVGSTIEQDRVIVKANGGS